MCGFSVLLVTGGPGQVVADSGDRLAGSGSRCDSACLSDAGRARFEIPANFGGGTVIAQRVQLYRGGGGAVGWRDPAATKRGPQGDRRHS
jgi:hypothetical protein